MSFNSNQPSGQQNKAPRVSRFAVASNVAKPSTVPVSSTASRPAISSLGTNLSAKRPLNNVFGDDDDDDDDSDDDTILSNNKNTSKPSSSTIQISSLVPPTKRPHLNIPSSTILSTSLSNISQSKVNETSTTPTNVVAPLVQNKDDDDDDDDDDPLSSLLSRSSSTAKTQQQQQQQRPPTIVPGTTLPIKLNLSIQQPQTSTTTTSTSQPAPLSSQQTNRSTDTTTTTTTPSAPAASYKHNNHNNDDDDDLYDPFADDFEVVDDDSAPVALGPQRLKDVLMHLTPEEKQAEIARRAEIQSAEKAQKEKERQEKEAKLLEIKAKQQERKNKYGQTPAPFDWPEDAFTVFIGNLSTDVNDSALRKSFSSIPGFVKAKVAYNERFQPLGFGFICFDNPQSMMTCIEEHNGKQLGMRNIHVIKPKGIYLERNMKLYQEWKEKHGQDVE